MKITAEFNSVEEVLNFTRIFGRTGFVSQQGESVQAPVKKVKPKEIIKSENTEIKEEPQSHSEDNETVSAENSQAVDKEEEPKVTKEMVRERLGAIMKAGKQKEVKELVAKYGASKVPDLKEEDYPAIYKEAEELL